MNISHKLGFQNSPKFAAIALGNCGGGLSRESFEFSTITSFAKLREDGLITVVRFVKTKIKKQSAQRIYLLIL